MTEHDTLFADALIACINQMYDPARFHDRTSVVALRQRDEEARIQAGEHEAVIYDEARGDYRVRTPEGVWTRRRTYRDAYAVATGAVKIRKRS